MTNEQAKKMIKAKLDCLKRETSGRILIAIIVIVMNVHYAMNRAIWGNRKRHWAWQSKH